MRRRLLESLGVATLIATVIVLLQVTAVSVGETPSATPWGHPNLEGIWLDVYSTPFERDEELGDRELTTAEERAERDQERMVSPGRNRRGDNGRRDVAGAYNAVYTSAKPAGPRTSLVVDPPNGRIPPLTTEAQRRADVRQEWRLMLLRNTETCRNMERGCDGGGVRATVAAQIRCRSLLQYGPHEPPRRPGGSEHGRPLHVGAHTRSQRVPSHRAGRGFHRDSL